MEIYNSLTADSLISTLVGERIKFYEYPPSGDVTGSWIVIDPIGPPLPTDYADDKPTAYEYLYQIDVWSKTDTEQKSIARQIGEVLRRELGAGQYGTGVDEWDKDLNIFRDGRRYRLKEYLLD
ncbi:DUF3168 domain-containing protein [Terribacillus saccharophilus]|uniref:tail completion protein gp17 n=1 Tax=Terribacillus saccharophilus TaxID=361277 RepID=UPI00398267AD